MTEETGKFDEGLVKELLLAQVPLSRVVAFFHGRAEERLISNIARELVSTNNSETREQSYGVEGLANIDISELGMNVLERSKSAINDNEFIRNHIENLSMQAPDELLDPLFHTLMRDPVVLSSGYVVDKSTVIDENGILKFRTCPWTRKPLKQDVYPLVSLTSKLKEFKLKRAQAMISTAKRLFDNNHMTDLKSVLLSAECFIEDVGEGTYKEIELPLAELTLATWEKNERVSKKLAGYPTSPKILGKAFVRIFQSLPSKNEDANNERRNLISERVSLLLGKTREAIAEKKFDDAEEWCNICERVKKTCGSDLVEIQVAFLRLDLGRKRGDDLTRLRVRVYRDIRDDPVAVQRFCDEEGLTRTELEELRDLRPLYLFKKTLSDNRRDSDWHSSLQSDPIEAQVDRILVSVESWGDQGWGNYKGNLGLALYDTNEVLVARCNLFGTYRSPSYSHGDHPNRMLQSDEDVVSKAKPGFTYKLEYTVGGGGGHSLRAHDWKCKMFYQGWSGEDNYHHMSDPEGVKGVYMGPVNAENKADGRGCLEYDNGYSFLGDFSNGSMVTGVCYLCNKVRWTMTDGKRTSSVNNTIVSAYPQDAQFKIDGMPSDDDNDSD